MHAALYNSVILATIQGKTYRVWNVCLQWKHNLVFTETHCYVMDSNRTCSLFLFFFGMKMCPDKRTRRSAWVNWWGNAGSQVRKTWQLSAPLGNKSVSQWRGNPSPSAARWLWLHTMTKKTMQLACHIFQNSEVWEQTLCWSRSHVPCVGFYKVREIFLLSCAYSQKVAARISEGRA